MKFTLGTRTLIRRGTQPDATILHTEELKSVAQLLETIQKKQQVCDRAIPLTHLRPTFTGGQMRLNVDSQSRYHKDLPNPMPVFTHAASHWHALVLPPKFWSGFKRLAALNPALASKVWDEFAQATSGKVVVARTAMIRNERGLPVRALRAVVSTVYAPYSHYQLVRDILDHSGHFGKLPVLDWWLTDAGIRIRFLGIDPATSAFARFDPKSVLMGKTLPVIDVWNSETKHRTVGVAAGLLNLTTLSGLGHWDSGMSHAWQHRGSPAKIRQALGQAFKDSTVAAQEIAQVYDDSGSYVVTDPEKWLRSYLTKHRLQTEGLPSNLLDIVLANLSSPDVTPGGKLATLVDAMTIAASACSNMYTADKVEKAASRLMRFGWLAAQKTNGVL